MSGETIRLLARQELFSELSPGDLESLATSLRSRHFSRGQIIFVEGDPGNCLYLVESGRVKVTLSAPDGREILLNTFGSGDVFGELALLDGEPRSADAVIQDDTRLLILQRTDFAVFVEEHPEVALKLLAAVSRRLRRTTRQVQDVALLDVSGRLARALLDLAEAIGQPTARSKARVIQVTQSDLAAAIGATRESVNKWLGHFERQGLIEIERGQVTVLDPAALGKRIY